MSKAGKSLRTFFLMFVMVICIAGCGNAQENGVSEQTAKNGTGTETSADVKEETDVTEQDSASSDNILVVYFSRTGEQYTVGVIDEGNTAIVAKMIADENGADLFEVLPIDDHYPMTYSELTDVAKQEQNDDARPEYAGEVP